MNYQSIKLGLIYYPSIRTISYLNIFKNIGIVPSEIIMMRGNLSISEDLKNDDKKYGYSKQFFDLNLDVMDYMKKSETRILNIDATHINDPSVKESLKKCKTKYFIFSGGGILRHELFNIGKQFIHVHPGILPRFRGSTCFYYSLLKDYSLGSTGFFMEEKIDTGKVIDQTSFNLNYKIQPSEKLFMDYILDPYIRAVTLKKILSKFIKYGEFSSYPQPYTKKPAYYIMHPILRSMTIQKINKNYNNNAPKGVIEI